MLFSALCTSALGSGAPPPPILCLSETSSLFEASPPRAHIIPRRPTWRPPAKSIYPLLCFHSLLQAALSGPHSSGPHGATMEVAGGRGWASVPLEPKCRLCLPQGSSLNQRPSRSPQDPENVGECFSCCISFLFVVWGDDTPGAVWGVKETAPPRVHTLGPGPPSDSRLSLSAPPGHTLLSPVISTRTENGGGR